MAKLQKKSIDQHLEEKLNTSIKKPFAFSIPEDIHFAFTVKCKSKGEFASHVLTELMKEYLQR